MMLMAKGELIAGIRAINTSATEEMLQQFDHGQLGCYLRRLRGRRPDAWYELPVAEPLEAPRASDPVLIRTQAVPVSVKRSTAPA